MHALLYQKSHIFQIQCTCFYFKSFRCHPMSSYIERKIVSYLILSVESIMPFLYAFYSTFHSSPSCSSRFASVQSSCDIWKAIDYPYFERNDDDELKRNEIIFDRGLMAIVRNKWRNNSFIATKRQYRREGGYGSVE